MRPDHFGYDSALYEELVNIHPILANEVWAVFVPQRLHELHST